MGLVDDDLVVVGHRYAKLDLEAAAPMSGLRPGDDDATTRNARTEFFETLHLRGDLGSDLFGRLAMPKGDVDWSLHIDPSLPLTKQMITPLIARRLAADQLPRRALAGSLTTNRRDRPSYSSPNSDLHRRDLQCPLNVCAVTRRRFPVGASPTRQPLQPEATGAVMEVTKWLKPSVWLVTYR
jgi:hypothetical protein